LVSITLGGATMQFNYTSEALDMTGLIYLRARYIRPTLDTFLSRDPCSGDVLRPASVNVFIARGGDDPPPRQNAQRSGAEVS